jgi:hypothetical protein
MPTISEMLNSGMSPQDIARSILEAKVSKGTPKKGKVDKAAVAAEKKRKAKAELVRNLKKRHGGKLHAKLLEEPEVKAAQATKGSPEKKVEAVHDALLKAASSKKWKDWTPPTKDRGGKIHSPSEVGAMDDVAARRAATRPGATPLEQRVAGMLDANKAAAAQGVKDKVVAALKAKGLHEHPSEGVRAAVAGIESGEKDPEEGMASLLHHMGKHEAAKLASAQSSASPANKNDAKDFANWSAPGSAKHIRRGGYMAQYMDRVSGRSTEAEVGHADKHKYMVSRFAEYGMHSAAGDNNLDHMWHLHPTAVKAYHQFMATGNADQFHATMASAGFKKEEVAKPAAAPSLPVATSAPLAATPAAPAAEEPEPAGLAIQKQFKAYAAEKKSHVMGEFAKIGVHNPAKDPVHAHAYAAYMKSTGNATSKAKLGQHVDTHLKAKRLLGTLKPSPDPAELARRAEATVKAGPMAASPSSSRKTETNLPSQPSLPVATSIPLPSSTPKPHTPTKNHGRIHSFLRWAGKKVGLVKESRSMNESVSSVAHAALHAIAHPIMLKHPEAVKLHHHIHEFLETLPRKARNKLRVKHDLENGETMIRGKHEHVVALQNHLERAGYDSSVHKSYHHDIDDLAHYHELAHASQYGSVATRSIVRTWNIPERHKAHVQRIAAQTVAKGEAPEDTHGANSKLYVQHFTAADYARQGAKVKHDPVQDSGMPDEWKQA